MNFCPMCDRSYFNRARLIKHIEKKHPDLYVMEDWDKPEET